MTGRRLSQGDESGQARTQGVQHRRYGHAIVCITVKLAAAAMPDCLSNARIAMWTVCR